MKDCGAGLSLAPNLVVYCERGPHENQWYHEGLLAPGSHWKVRWNPIGSLLTTPPTLVPARKTWEQAKAEARCYVPAVRLVAVRTGGQTGDGGVSLSLSRLRATVTCEDQALVPTDHCLRWGCENAKLVKQGRFWVCPRCQSSYGTSPMGDDDE